MCSRKLLIDSELPHVVDVCHAGSMARPQESCTMVLLCRTALGRQTQVRSEY